MINKIRFDSIKGIFFIGDIHGYFESIGLSVSRYNLKDSLIVVCGDIGLGMDGDKTHDNLCHAFKKLNTTLKEQNCYVAFVRGNHDDPSYFNDSTIREKYAKYKHIHIIPDYTVLEVYKMPFLLYANILCVGGATSIDRKIRIAEEVIYGTNHKSYWENELPYFDEAIITKINQEFANNIQVFCGHTCPSFCYPQDKSSSTLQTFLKQDEGLLELLNQERMVMDSIFWALKNGGQDKLKDWYYGHFHEHKIEQHHGVDFRLCDCSELNTFIEKI